MKQALLIFAKNPLAGKVKTRLAAAIGEQAALVVYSQLLAHTASITKHLAVDKFVFYAEYIEAHDLWHAKHYFKRVQTGNDLGERMKNAFDAVFMMSYDRMVIIGTDCPGLNEHLITKAFSELDRHDVVIGPAEDGGYYLLGMNKLYPAIFDNIQWSTDTVLDATKKKCAALHLNYHLLPVLKDIDEVDDLVHIKNEIV
jgi:rSAM/selenodomain-associated transferase 1